MFVGHNIKRLREKQGKTRKHLAPEAKMVYETLRRYENNERRTPLATRKLLAICLNTTLEEIETGVPPTEKKNSPAAKVHELCKIAAAVENPRDLSNDLLIKLGKGIVELLGEGR